MNTINQHFSRDRQTPRFQNRSISYNVHRKMAAGATTNTRRPEATIDHMKRIAAYQTTILATLAGLALALTSCGSSHRVLKPPVPTPFTSAQIVYDGNSNVEPGEEAIVRQYFEKHLSVCIYEKRLFTKGPGISVRYQILSAEKGNRAMRAFLGAGTGTVVIRVDFSDPSGRSLGSISAQGEVSG